MPIALLWWIMKIKNLLKAENWWIIILAFTIIWMLFTIFTEPEYTKALNFIIPGLRITFLSTIISFLIAIVLGLISGIGRISDNKIASTLSRTYIEFIRGVPVFGSPQTQKAGELTINVVKDYEENCNTNNRFNYNYFSSQQCIYKYITDYNKFDSKCNFGPLIKYFFVT